MCLLIEMGIPITLAIEKEYGAANILKEEHEKEHKHERMKFLEEVESSFQEKNLKLQT